MDFGEAIRALKQGKRVARVGWNGKGMWLFLASGGAEVGVELVLAFNRDDIAQQHAWALTGCINDGASICMKTAQNTIVVGWLASQTDMLAEDWEEVT